MARPRQRVRSLSKNKSLVRQQRQHIVETAFEVFAERGYEKTTVREIAAKAGMTPGNIYRYLGSKDDILHLLCQRSYDNTMRITNAFNTNLAKDMSILEALKGSIINYLQMSDRQSNAFIFFDRNVQSLSEQDRTIVRDTWIELVGFFEKLIRKGVRRGEFKVEYPALLAHNIASLGHEWALRKWYLNERYSLKEFSNKQIEIIMNILLIVQSEGEKEHGKEKSTIR
jgi:TetR/AcrR family transcriptional regulator, cholesterol catabolism regulator